jgi:hypothetical protein
MDERAGQKGSPRLGVDLTGETLLDQYAVRERIGSGGMGAVYVADDSNLGRTVVIKVPHPQFLGEAGFRDRFEREVQGLIGLEHPHVVRILARGIHEGIPFVVLQHLRGGSLAERLAAAPGGRIPLPLLITWMRQVAATLDFLHERDIVHRDVKPGNILFDEHGNVFVSDLGIAKALGDPDATITATGGAVGSPLYMAPEQGRRGPLTGAADQYALAATLYEALGGRPPFEGGTPIEILLRKASDTPLDIRRRRPDLPSSAAKVIMRGLARDPADRFPSCRAFVEAFDAAIAAGGALSRTEFPLDRTSTAPVPVGQRIGNAARRPRSWVVGLVGLASLVGLGVFLPKVLAPSGSAEREHAAAHPSLVPPSPAERREALEARRAALARRRTTWPGPDRDVQAHLDDAATAITVAEHALEHDALDDVEEALAEAEAALDLADATREGVLAAMAVLAWPVTKGLPPPPAEILEQQRAAEEAYRRKDYLASERASREVVRAFRSASKRVDGSDAGPTDGELSDCLAELSVQRGAVSRAIQDVATFRRDASAALRRLAKEETLPPDERYRRRENVITAIVERELHARRLEDLQRLLSDPERIRQRGSMLAAVRNLPPRDPLRSGLRSYLNGIAQLVRELPSWTPARDLQAKGGPLREQERPGDDFQLQLDLADLTRSGDADALVLRDALSRARLGVTVYSYRGPLQGGDLPRGGPGWYLLYADWPRDTGLAGSPRVGDAQPPRLVLEGGLWSWDEGDADYAVLSPEAYATGGGLVRPTQPWSNLTLRLERVSVMEPAATDSSEGEAPEPPTHVRFARLLSRTASSRLGGASLLRRLGGALEIHLARLEAGLDRLGLDRRNLGDRLLAVGHDREQAEASLREASDGDLGDRQLALLRADAALARAREATEKWDGSIPARVEGPRSRLLALRTQIEQREWERVQKTLAELDGQVRTLRSEHEAVLQSMDAPRWAPGTGAASTAGLVFAPGSVDRLATWPGRDRIRDALDAGSLRLRLEPDGCYVLVARYGDRSLSEAGTVRPVGDGPGLELVCEVEGRGPVEERPWRGVAVTVDAETGRFRLVPTGQPPPWDLPLLARVVQDVQQHPLAPLALGILEPQPGAVLGESDVHVVAQVPRFVPGLLVFVSQGGSQAGELGAPLERVSGETDPARYEGRAAVSEGKVTLTVRAGGPDLKMPARTVTFSVDRTPPRIMVDPGRLDQADGAVATTDLEIHGTVLDANPRSLALRVGDGPPLPVALRQAGNGATNERPFAVTATLPAGGAAPVPVILVARDAAGHETPRTLGPFRVDPLAYHRTLAIRAAGKGPEDFATADWSAVASRLKEVQRLGGTVPAYVSDGVRKWQTPPIFRLEGKPVFQVGDPIQFNVEFRTWRYKVERLVVQEGDTQLHAKGRIKEELVYEAPSEKEPGYRRFFIKTTDPSVDPPEIRVQRVHEVLVLTKADFQTLRLRFQEGYQRGQIEAYTRSARPAYVKEEDWQRVIGAMAGAAQSGSATGMDLTDFLGAASALGGGRLPIPDPSGLIPRGLPFPFR